MSRTTRTAVAHVLAECQGCDWRSDNTNALGNAARHHDATRHVVQVEQAIVIVYGDQAQALADAGQTTIEEAIDNGGSLDP